jgi:acyl-CoA synthetase (AMP-forming)/AMP-acid ligase II
MITDTAAALLGRDFGLLADLIACHARERSEKSALVQGEDSVSYRVLNAAMNRIAANLRRQGAAPGDNVVIVSETTLPCALAFLGALRAGCTPTPLPPSATAAQLEAMIHDCRAALVFADQESALRLGGVAAHLIRLDQLEDWLDPSEDKSEPVIRGPEDPFNIIYSSGTTGAPKGIVHNNAMRWRQIRSFAPFGFGDAVTLVATPLYSNTTLVSFLPTLAFGGTAVLLGKFDAVKFLETSQRHRVNHAMLVPVQYQRIMASPKFDDFDLSSYAVKFCTSAHFPKELKADVLKRWPGLLFEFYGMTEGGGSCTLFANEHPDKLHTVGAPGPETDIRIIDDAGIEAPKGAIGEIVGRSTVMMSGYYGRPDATDAATWISPEGHRFIRHGDLGTFDEDGFLILMGRKKDLIISGGFNIYPADIEAVLLEHPQIDDCAVIGVPSEKWGETPFAYFVSRDPSLRSEDVLEWLNPRLGKTQRLSGLEAIAQLPRSQIGKVLKRDLQDLHRAAHGSAQNSPLTPEHPETDQ